MDVEPTSLSGAAGDIFDASKATNISTQDHFNALIAAVDTAAGNSSGGSRFMGAHSRCLSAAGMAAEQLIGVLEYTGDALYQAAFDFSATDEAAADGFSFNENEPPMGSGPR